MSKSSSIAPKERVNITYTAHIGDAKQEVELPNKLLVVGDFTMREDEDGIQERDTVEVNKNNFNDVMAKQNLKVSMVVENKLTDAEGIDMNVSLDFRNIKDFEPGNIVKKVPELNSLLELRDALTFLKGPLGNIPAFKKQLERLLNDEGTRAKLMNELGIDKE
ncbi:type VI secretion system contractile sheath small subunit [Rheinheimera maricola]|uniref:Type VI secretion system contractile sheath small subunit n=1 Tax=Rheinheimera maricola TaxID=2793282 RepID=A0ABS7XFV5_9GAMM|nr:type VI secretion system contractile sheath small subunit [Rheinheimera maricola]MBZ9613412.1 type VI secretion system contractile sheath small subunit [Rheinheimera maricola]